MRQVIVTARPETEDRRSRAHWKVSALVLVTFIALVLPAAAEAAAPRRLTANASVSLEQVLTVTGRVSPPRPAWRVRLQRRVRSSGRNHWVNRGRTVGVDAHGIYVIKQTMTGVAVLRAVVLFRG